MLPLALPGLSLPPPSRYATIVDWSMIMAAGVVITVPAAAFCIAVQRYLIQGSGAGDVKS